MAIANRVTCVLLAAAMQGVLAVQADAGPPDPRGPLNATTAAVVAPVAVPGPLQPDSVSTGYRSLHFNSYVSSGSFPFQLTADNEYFFVSDAIGNVVSQYQIVAGGAAFVRNFGAPGSGAGQFNGPEQVAVVGNDIYVADFSNNRVQRFNKSTGAYISQFGVPGSGPGQFSNPCGLVYNPVNSLLYVSEIGNDRIQTFSTAGIYQGQFASFGAGDGQLDNPWSLAVDSIGNIYVADGSNNRVSKFNSSGSWMRHIGVGISIPIGVAVDNSNVVWVTSSGANDIYAYDARGNYLSYYYGLAPATWAEGYFKDVRGIAATPSLAIAPYNGTSAMLVADGTSKTVQLFSTALQPTAHPPVNTIGGIGDYNAQVAFDSAQNIYVTSFNANLVYKFDKFGTFVTQWGATGSGNGQFSGASGIAIDDSDNVYVADRNNNRIQKFDSSGGYLAQWGSLGTGNGQFNHPSDLATDGSWLYVTEEVNNRVQKFSLTGAYVRQWGTAGSGDGQFNNPVGIAVDRNRNQVYVAEFNASRIQQFTVFGDFIKVLGDSIIGSGTLDGPLGLATDQHGNLYCSDLHNGRVVQYNDNGTYLTNFAVAGPVGVAVDPRTAQIYVGAISGGTINRFGATVGKTDTIGLYRPASQSFLLRNANTPGVPHISVAVIGASATDLPITGDWNGDGIDTPGLYRPATSTFYLWERWTGLSIATADHVLAFGGAGDRPLSGDWDGDGKDSIGVYRPSNGTLYLQNRLLAGPADYGVELGIAGDLGIVGDWNTDGVMSAGVYRASDGRFHVSNRNTTGVVGEDAAYPLGNGRDAPLTGDWSSNGYSGLGVYRSATGTFYLKYTLDNAPADLIVGFDGDRLFRDGFEQLAGDLPLGGHWGSAPE